MSNIKALLSSFHQKPIVIYPVYVKIMGSYEGAAVLNQILYWHQQMGKKFYKTDNDFMEELGLTKYSIKTIKKVLKNIDFIIVTREQIPAKTFYDVDYDRLGDYLEANSQLVENRPTRCVENRPTRCVENRQSITESTTETTHNNVLFDEFWTIYPRKEKKKGAERVFNRLSQKKQRLAIDDIKSGRFESTDRRFIPQPTSYLNAERWNDEQPTTHQFDPVLAMSV